MLDILYFPIWWYTTGLKKRAKGFVNNLKGLSQYLALGILIKYLFKPMFGQYDWKGRIISFFMRLIQLIIYLIIFLIGGILMFALLIIWIILPIVAVWQIIKLI
ncbi:MAG: hypothetical protein ACP5IX_01335 [Patescibacteria group bacterium]